MLLGPYLTSVAKQAACPGIDNDATCRVDLHVVGIPVSPGSLVFYVVTVSTILSALVLPIVGAAGRPHRAPQGADVRLRLGRLGRRRRRWCSSPGTTGSSAWC